MRQRLWSERAFAAYVILLLPLAYFYSALKGDLALVQGDGWTANLGLRILTGQLLAHGHLPLWNPYIFSGMPLLASVYPGVLYPPNWLFAALSPGIAMTIVVVTTYHIAMAGAYRYARALGINRVGAIATGIVFAFGGYMVISMGQTSNIAAAAWLPWILLAVEKLYLQTTRRWAALGAVFIALQFFAGVPQMTWYTALVTGAYFVYSALIRAPRGSRLGFAITGAWMAVCGAMLCAIQLLPLRELQRQSGRAGISYEYFAAYSFPPKQALALLFPYFFGGAMLPPYRVSYWGESGIFITCGYIGLLSWLLGLIAVIGWRRQSIVWFWIATALVSLFLSFGDYLPFGLNHVLYRTPVYNLFRASYRHMLEFTLAGAVLTGLGINYLALADRKQAIRAFACSAVAMTLIVITILIAYFVGGGYLEATPPRPALGDSASNPELYLPLIFFVISLVVLWNFARRRTIRAGALLLPILILDLVAYGHFLEWRLYIFKIADNLADAPSVKYIKSREPDLNSFRILSYAAQPFGANYGLLNHPNISIARGLQSAAGYDMLRMERPAAVMGDMTPDGVVQNQDAFKSADQGLNLFNIKYLLFERTNPFGTDVNITYEGVRFREKPLGLNLSHGAHREIEIDGPAFTELAIVSTLSDSTNLVNGTPIVKLKLHTKDGRLIEREIQAGRDSSEWAYDRADVITSIKHARGKVIESWPFKDTAGDFEGHRYLARLPFERAEIKKIELDYLAQEGQIEILRASFFDSTTGLSIPMDAFQLPPERWQKLASFGGVDLYQNLKAAPRAWFVSNVAAASAPEILQTIRQGKDPNGKAFDPKAIAFIDTDDYDELGLPTVQFGAGADSTATVTRYEPQRINLKTRNSSNGFLVLSEVYYPGWEAWVDHVKTPIHRVNFTLRGLAIPSGEHEISIVYTAPGFRKGAMISGVGMLFLLISFLLPILLKPYKGFFLTPFDDFNRERRA
jgi:hypothetical protein